MDTNKKKNKGPYADVNNPYELMDIDISHLFQYESNEKLFVKCNLETVK